MRHAHKLGLECLVVFRYKVVQDKACRKSTQDEVELKYIGKREQSHEQQHGKAHVGLRGRLGTLRDPGVDFATETVHTLGKCSNENAEQHKSDENRHACDLGARREQKCHGDNGPQFAPGAVRKNRVTYARTHKPALSHDRQ